jgi:hypothetical protein
MKLTSIFRHPEGGVAAGIGTAIAVYLIYNSSLPPAIDARMAPANDSNIEAARKGAAMKSAGLIGLVFLITRDVNAFVISGASLGGVDYLYKHHNAINPDTGKWEPADSSMNSMSPMASLHPLPDYSQDAEQYA